MSSGLNNVFKSIGICGAGKMGESLFNLISKLDFSIILYNRSDSKLDKVSKSYERRISFARSSDTANKNISFTKNIADLAECDIIFEFISEDIETKKDLIKELMSQRKNSEQIIATGSSTIIPSKVCMAQYLRYCAGVHFIYPVQYIKSVEVVLNSEISDTAADKIKNFLISIGKRPFLVTEETGTFTIKILTAIQNEAFRLLQIIDIKPEQIDRILSKYNMIFPPFELCDSVGPEIIYNSIKTLYEGTSEYYRYQEFADYLKNLKTCINDNFISNHNKQYTTLDEEKEIHINDILMLVYINTCLNFLDKGLLETNELDFAMSEINQSSSGPISIAFERGAENILHSLELYSKLYGKQFEPPEILRYIVKFRLGRDEIDRQIRMFKVGGVRPDWHY